MKNTITVSNLTKYYADFLAVDNISFTIEKGTIVGFVGKNGAGKSTTIRSILNFISPSNGSCCVLGLDSISQSKKMRNIVGYMPSDANFPPNITSRELFAFCSSIAHVGIEESLKLAEYFELDTSKPISQLSLGNRKKVSIIQLLLKKNDVLILDEPTSGLDPLMQERFFDLLLKEKEKGVTIFLSSHNLVEIERYCDRALIIKDGKIIDDIDMNNSIIKRSQVVSFTTKDGAEHSFEYSEDANDLIQKLSTYDLLHVEIKNKSVEDEFIKYYKEESESEVS
ncbi:MAG: ABC transporter ATP-binding protein [Lachnospiraceae bacterium]